MSQNVGTQQTQHHHTAPVGVVRNGPEVSMQKKLHPRGNGIANSINVPRSFAARTELVQVSQGSCLDSMELSFDATSFNKATNSGVAFDSRMPSPELATIASVLSAGGDSTDINADILPETSMEAPDLSGLVKPCGRPVSTTHYSTVYVGWYGHHKVAIKVLRMIKSNEVTSRKFRRERFIWWHLRHPNVLRLQGYLKYAEGLEVSHHALVSEWAERGSAADYLKQDLGWDQRVNLLYDVVKGLLYLHGLDPSVVHGDLKLTNVLISKDGVGQLCDFGLARLLKAESGSGLTTTTPHTGTVRFLSHELVEGNEWAMPTKATDMYAFGCLALEIIHKTTPYSHLDKEWKISRAIAEGRPPAERPMGFDNAPPLWDLMKACWSTDPSKRPTADDVCSYLDPHLQLLSDALEAAYKVTHESPYGHATILFQQLPVPSSPASPTSPARLPPPRSPIVPHAPPQHTSYTRLQLPPFEGPEVVQAGCIGEEADKEQLPFYRRAYCRVIDSCAQLKSKLLSLGPSCHIVPNITAWPARLRVNWPWTHPSTRI